MRELIEQLLKEVGIGRSSGTATFAARIEISKDSDVAHHGASIELTHTVEDALRLRIAATYLFHDAVDRAILTIVGHHHVLEETEERGDDHGQGSSLGITRKIKTNQLDALGILASKGFNKFKDIELARYTDMVSHILCSDCSSSLQRETEFVHFVGETAKISSDEVLKHVDGLGFGVDAKRLQETRKDAGQFVVTHLVALIDFSNLFAKLHQFGGTGDSGSLIDDDEDSAWAGLLKVETKVVELEGTLVKSLRFSKQDKLFFGHHGETTTGRDNISYRELACTCKELHQIEILLVIGEHRIEEKVGELVNEKGFFAMQKIDRSVLPLLNLGLYALKIVGFLCHFEFL